MRTIMFYSYKGGAGRTVAAANVAAAFAKLGKRTAIIDLDFEAPGLHHVFAVEKLYQCTSGMGIQDYLQGGAELPDLMKHASIDLLANKPWIVDRRAGMLFIVASTKPTQLDATDPGLGSRMRELQNTLKEEGTEILVVDAASGVREAYSIALDACEEMLIFFRWSKQHIAGTLKMLDHLKGLRRLGLKRSFRLIASASPDEQAFQQIENVRLRNDLALVKDDVRERIRTKLSECEADPADIFHEIPEFLEMKWREAVVVFRDENSSYEELARKLINADQPVSMSTSVQG